LGRFHPSKQSQSCVSGIDAKACIIHTMAELDLEEPDFSAKSMRHQEKQT